MEILFLGTSAGWPLPRLGCKCEICTSKDPKDTRWRPVILVNKSVLIDCGPDIYHQLRKIENGKWKIENLKALIITHAHFDHILGYYDITHLYNRAPELKLYLTQPTLNGLRRIHPYPLTPFKPEVIRPPEAWEIERTKFTFIPVKHDSFPTWGIKMKERKLVAYLPDVKKLPKEQRRTCSGVHLLILDGSSLGKAGQTRIHQNILEGIELGKRLKAKQVYFTHIGHKTGKHQELEKIVQKEGGKNYHIAFDGLELTI
jgi:phosphoribosyl 1,2-cyclic phosphate phosphodiesterase